jgi:hypothetical protein
VLLAPNFDVRVGDYIQVDVGAGVYETVAVTNVSGDAGSNITITHAALSGAGTATETAYILRSGCADTGESLTITVECPVVSEKCMFTTYGKLGLANVGRTVTMESEPYFKSWEQFLMRDNSVGMSFLAVLGDTSNNICALYIPKKVNASVTLNNNEIMTQTVSSRGVNDGVLGDDYEFVMAAF